MIPMIRSGAFMLIGAMLSKAYSPEAAVLAAVVIVLLGVAIDLEMGRRAGGE